MGLKSASEFAGRTYDYLIIGGGTAGLAVAARLSEDPSIIVGVLEAGPVALDEAIINDPGRMLQTLGTEYDWQFETVPQAGFEGRTVAFPRGKVLGGSSALNLMTWNRGCREDYDAWEKLGNRDWGWDGLLPFFKKSEAFHPPNKETQATNREYYDRNATGSDGPVQVSYSKAYNPTHQLAWDALVSLGALENKAHQAGSNIGVWANPTTVHPDTARRSYAATAYFEPNAKRPNLFVLSDALVHKVVIDQDAGQWTATGAQFSSGGKEYVASASREVILSAGTVQSPQLLELSGVGNPQILADAGVDVKVANPKVGENLQDHFMTVSVFEVDPSLEHTNAGAPAAPMVYLPIEKIASKEFFQPFASRVQELETLPPKKSAIFKSRFKPGANLGQFEYIFDLGNYSSFFAPGLSDGKRYASMFQILQYPFSEGSIHIKPSTTAETGVSGRPQILEKPTIDPRYYTGANGALDLEIMLQCVRFTEKLCSKEPLSSWIRSRAYPPPSVVSDDQWKDWVLQNTTTDWHPIGTCAMGGHEGIKGGVVDDRLRVYGVKRLRVVDASIMPLQVSAHLQATVYAIGEKGAHIIREDMVGKRG